METGAQSPEPWENTLLQDLHLDRLELPGDTVQRQESHRKGPTCSRARWELRSALPQNQVIAWWQSEKHVKQLIWASLQLYRNATLLLHGANHVCFGCMQFEGRAFLQVEFAVLIFYSSTFSSLNKYRPLFKDMHILSAGKDCIKSEKHRKRPNFHLSSPRWLILTVCCHWVLPLCFLALST